MAKIIAQTKSGYLLDMSSQEMSRLVGYYWPGEEGCPRFQPGDEISMHAMYERLRGLKSAEGVLVSAAEKLREVAGLLDTDIVPVVAAKADAKKKPKETSA